MHISSIRLNQNIIINDITNANLNSEFNLLLKRTFIQNQNTDWLGYSNSEKTPRTTENCHREELESNRIMVIFLFGKATVIVATEIKPFDSLQYLIIAQVL